MPDRALATARERRDRAADATLAGFGLHLRRIADDPAALTAFLAEAGIGQDAHPAEVLRAVADRIPQIGATFDEWDSLAFTLRCRTCGDSRGEHVGARRCMTATCTCVAYVPPSLSDAVAQVGRDFTDAERADFAAAIRERSDPVRDATADLDLDDLLAPWLPACARHDGPGEGHDCVCPTGDVRPVLRQLAGMVLDLRRRLTAAQRGPAVVDVATPAMPDITDAATGRP